MEFLSPIAKELSHLSVFQLVQISLGEFYF